MVRIDMENKLTIFRIDVSKETGQVLLLIETECGSRPVMGWPNIHGLKDFATDLLSICSQEKEKNDTS